MSLLREYISLWLLKFLARRNQFGQAYLSGDTTHDCPLHLKFKNMNSGRYYVLKLSLRLLSQTLFKGFAHFKMTWVFQNQVFLKLFVRSSIYHKGNVCHVTRMHRHPRQHVPYGSNQMVDCTYRNDSSRHSVRLELFK